MNAFHPDNNLTPQPSSAWSPLNTLCRNVPKSTESHEEQINCLNADSAKTTAKLREVPVFFGFRELVIFLFCWTEFYIIVVYLIFAKPCTHTADHAEGKS